MPGTSVIGLQWGDEAKGKLVDLLAERLGVDIVVRYQGGANAGHTVVIGRDNLQTAPDPQRDPDRWRDECDYARGGVQPADCPAGN